MERRPPQFNMQQPSANGNNAPD